MIADPVGAVIGVGQGFLLLGIFHRLGSLRSTQRVLEERIGRLERRLNASAADSDG